MKNLGTTVTETPNGDYYYTTLQGKPVCVVVPKNYVEEQATQILFHFHGWRIAPWDTTPQGTIEHFDFAGILNRTKPLLMVIPIGDHGGGRYYNLGQTWGHTRFIQSALDELQAPYKTMILSGHSGAYVPIGQILDGGTTLPINNVFMFDAMYTTHTKPYERYLLDTGFSKKMEHDLYCASRLDTGVYENTKILMQYSNAHIYQAKTDNHWDVVSMYMPKFLEAV